MDTEQFLEAIRAASEALKGGQIAEATVEFTQEVGERTDTLRVELDRDPYKPQNT